MKATFLSQLFFLFIACTDCLSQTLDFKMYNLPNGSTFWTISAITQDKRGYMWIATEKGLYRYDGKHYNFYRNDSLNENSLQQ
jgi:ligand-binding sensor domain-containing protein